MITKEEYEKAVTVINQYKTEQEDIKNTNRMTLGYFVGRIPVIEGKGGTIRLINALLNGIEDQEWLHEKNPNRFNEVIYMDEIDEILKFRGIGKKTAIQFTKYKNEIMNKNEDAFNL